MRLAARAGRKAGSTATAAEEAGATGLTFAEAAARLPEEGEIQLALPVSAVLLERMRLPATDREELAGMVRLQLEKTLPFPPEEVASDFEIVQTGETGTLLLAITVYNAQLDALCEPLDAGVGLPDRITLFALHIAAACSPDEVVCAIFRELDSVTVAIVENTKLSFAESLGDAAAVDAETFFENLPATLLAAELDGVPMNFTRVRLDATLGDWAEPAAAFFGAPVETIALDDDLPEPAIDLVPEAWKQERRQEERAGQYRSRFLLAGGIYFALILGAAGYLIWLQRHLTALTREAAEIAPQMESIASHKGRWAALAPAIEPAHYTVEILYQVSRSLPSDAMRITLFEQSPEQFLVEGEAPTANLAIEFGEKLKKNAELSGYQFEAAPPTILPNGGAQMRIFGRQ